MKDLNLVSEAALLEPKHLVEPGSWVGHIPFGSWLISVLKPKVVVELGTHTGNSYLSFCQAILKSGVAAQSFAVDTWRGDGHSGEYPESVFLTLKEVHDPLYGDFSQLLRMTFDDAIYRFSDESIDLLHIDGYHTYEAVKHDFETWLPKVSKRGIVLFHDTSVFEKDFGVYRLWEELLEKFPGFNFKHCNGLGVLLIGEERLKILEDLCVFDFQNNPNWTLVASLFERLGENIERKLRLSIADRASYNQQQKIESISETLRASQNHISNIENILDKRNTRITDLEQALAGRSDHIVNLEKILDARNKHIIYLEKTLDNLNKCVTSLEEQLSGKNNYIINLEEQLRDKNNDITSLEEQLNNKNDYIINLEEQLNDKNNHIINLDETLDGNLKAITNLESNIASLDQQKNSSLAQLREHEIELLTITQSTSWKVTAPIRAFGIKYPEVAKNSRRLFKLLWWAVTGQLDYSKPLLKLRIQDEINQDLTLLIRSELFNEKWYLEQYPDVAKANINPLLHYLNFGTLEGRNPNPFFNNEWYLAQYPDVKKTGVNPLCHYIRYGHAEGRNPSPLFDTDWYLNQYPDVARSKINPLLHYLRHGVAEGRLPKPKFVGDYTEWVRRYDIIDDAKRVNIKHQIKELKYQPLISLVMPVYNPPPIYLDAAINSVKNQLYPNWELCIADDASTDPEVQMILAQHASQDNRIKVVYRKENGHISRASNSALATATGDFVALLDHDDQISEHSLYMVAKAINETPDAQLIYSDEDKIDESGNRFQPYFKCELNYELLLAHNMITHLGVYNRNLISKIGGFRTGYEGAQDYDLALRALEEIDPSKVVHIPHILYHWRAIQGSTALASNEKDYAAEAGRKAVADHLDRQGFDAKVLPAPEAPGYNRVKFLLPTNLPLVSIIIPTRDRADLLGICVDSILEKTSYPDYEIIIIDNGSVEPSTERLFERLPKKLVRIERYNLPFNFSAINNYGAQLARGDFLCLMNNDIEIVTPDWLEEMVSFGIRPDVGCVGSRLWYPDGRLQHGGIILGIGGVAGHSHKYLQRGGPSYFSRTVLHQSLSAVTAACLLVTKSIYNEVKGLDETLGVAFNDVDFCLQVREAGYRNIWTPYAEMIHHESASRGKEDTSEKQERFSKEIRIMKERWGDQLFNDPAYNPNLSLENESFTYAFPPRTTLFC